MVSQTVGTRFESMRPQGYGLLRAMLVGGALLCTPASGAALPIDFESVEDVIGAGVIVDSQFAGEGLTFANATALTSHHPRKAGRASFL
jgi:hypothetical protein